MAKFAAFRLLAILASYLPNSWLTALGYLAGAVAFIFARRARSAVLANLRVVRPQASESERRRLAVRTFVHGAWGYLELLGLPRKVTLEQLLGSYRVQGWEHFDRAVTEGKGVVLVTAHLGQPHIAGQLIVARGVPGTVIVEQLEPPQLHALVARIRGHFGLHMVALGAHALRDAVTALRRQELVVILCDRDVAGTGEVIPFFGHPTRVTTAPAALARRTGAMVLPTIAYRAGLFHGYAIVDEPFFVDRTSDPPEDVLAATQRIMDGIERSIRVHPEQWAVFSEVWPGHDQEDRQKESSLSSVTIPREGTAHSSIEAAGDT
jgi:KDO2-lipid IV(A) lauroyltransferase